MEETEYKDALHTLVEHPCLFAKAVMRQCAGCEKARRVNIAEREAVLCLDQSWRAQCQAFLDAVYGKAQFALNLLEKPTHLPHAKKLKLQCGSIEALRDIHGEQAATSIHALLAQSKGGGEDFEHLPFAEVMRHIKQYKVRGK